MVLLVASGREFGLRFPPAISSLAVTRWARTSRLGLPWFPPDLKSCKDADVK